MRRNAFHSDPYHRPAHMLYVPAVMLHSMQLQLHSGMILSHPMILCPVENSTQLEIASRCASSQGTAATARVNRGALQLVTRLRVESVDSPQILNAAPCMCPGTQGTCTELHMQGNLEAAGCCRHCKLQTAFAVTSPSSSKRALETPMEKLASTARRATEGRAISRDSQVGFCRQFSSSRAGLQGGPKG